MLTVGDKVRIGNRHARMYSYDPVVGKAGTVAEVRERPYYEFEYVKVLIDDGRVRMRDWHIQKEDCIVIEPKTNRQALSLLRRK